MNTNKLRFVESAGNEDLTKRKISLRQRMKERRADNENRDVKETLLCDRFFELINSLENKMMGAGTRRTVFVYLSFSSEAPTDKLIESLQEKGFRVLCPRIEKDEMFSVEHGDDFTLSHMGIREPVGEIYTKTPDCVVVPLLAVDKKGNRLGYGKGYYDRYLAKHKEAKRIGYCFDFQLLQEVPFNENDEKLDYIVTDKQVVETSARK
jgi:5-formyltetrahydrofolate cyclo-ligase